MNQSHGSADFFLHCRDSLFFLTDDNETLFADNEHLCPWCKSTWLYIRVHWNCSSSAWWTKSTILHTYHALLYCNVPGLIRGCCRSPDPSWNPHICISTMARGIALVLSLLLPFYVSAQGIDVFSEGPYTPGRVFVNRFSHLGLDHNLVVHAPNATGTFPVIYFSSGFGGKTLLC